MYGRRIREVEEEEAAEVDCKFLHVFLVFVRVIILFVLVGGWFMTLYHVILGLLYIQIIGETINASFPF